MSIIQNLRDKYLGVTVVVVILALLGFLLTDSINSSMNSFMGGGRPDNLASVNGNEISQQQFDEAMQNAETNYKVQNPDAEMNDVTVDQLRSNVIGELIRNELMLEEFNRINLNVSAAELKYFMTSDNASPQLKQIPAFIDRQTGRFNGNLVKEYDRMTKSNSSEMTLEDKQRWAAFKKSLMEERKMNKFNALIVQSTYIPNFIAEQQLVSTQQYVAADFVKIPYDQIPQTDLKVTDEDLQKLINARKEQFRVNEEGRNAEYVIFPEIPSSKDSAAMIKELETKLAGFQAASDPIAYINQNSSIQFIDEYILAKDVKNPEILSASTGQIVGPIFNNNLVTYTKILATKQVPDSVNAQHILLAGGENQTREALQSKADSIMALIRSGSLSFAQAAADFSTDESNKQNAGNLNWFGRGMMVQSFEDSCFSHKPGDMFSVISQFGMHIVRLIDQKDFKPSYKLGNLSVFFEPSDETKAKVSNQINNFVAAAKDPKKFNEALTGQGLTKRLIQNARKSSNNIPGLGLSGPVNKWLFSHKKNDISEPMVVEGGKVVLLITGEIKKGYQKPEDIRSTWEPVVMNTKKAEKIAKENSNITDLNTLAAKYKTEVVTADSVIFAGTFVPNLGSEPKIMGYLYYPGFKSGSVSKPIAGNTGVVVIKKKAESKPAAPIDKGQLQMIKNALGSRYGGRAIQDAVNTLYLKAKVEDNLNQFY